MNRARREPPKSASTSIANDPNAAKVAVWGSWIALSATAKTAGMTIAARAALLSELRSGSANWPRSQRHASRALEPAVGTAPDHRAAERLSGCGLAASGDLRRLGEEAVDLVGRRRPGEEEALREIAAELSQRRQLPVGLDALGDREQAERVGEADEVRRDRGVLRIVLDALDERAIDLDQVDREAPELAERREAGAEVVDCDPHPHVVKSSELGAGALAGEPCLDERRLGHLEAQAGRGETRPLEHLAHELADAAVRELLSGQVDPGDEPFREGRIREPPRGLGARFVEHELAERDDEPSRLRGGNELGGRNGAPRRRVPPQERLDADDLGGVERDLGLVVEAELATLEREPQLVLEAEELSELASHVV